MTPSAWKGTILEDPLPTLIHFVPMEERLERVVQEIEALQAVHRDWDPLVIWEPDIVR
jgi:hypothetical protein